MEYSYQVKCVCGIQVMGWAFANGEHITKEHLIVYWLAPVEATLAAGWLFGVLVGLKKDKVPTPRKEEASELKPKKED